MIFVTNCFITWKKIKFFTRCFLILQKLSIQLIIPFLLKKLKQYGIRGTPLELLKNYLQNKKQQTLYQGTLSDYKTITCGVSQGSTLGPLLFLIYITDLPHHTNKIVCR